MEPQLNGKERAHSIESRIETIDEELHRAPQICASEWRGEETKRDVESGQTSTPRGGNGDHDQMESGHGPGSHARGCVCDNHGAHVRVGGNSWYGL